MRLLITGTDTGVGKTLVTCGLAASLVDRGKRVAVMKPAETGCEESAGALHGSDASLLAFFSNCSLPLDELCPYRFAPPLAPSVAAELEGVSIRPERLVTLFRRMSERHDVVLVEGAGGLLVPLADQYTFADLARDLEVPILVVVGSKLGALNHTLLTLSYIQNSSLPLKGYILNHTAAASNEATRTNAETLRKLTDVPCLGCLPHLPLSDNRDQVRDMLVETFGRKVDVDSLLA